MRKKWDMKWDTTPKQVKALVRGLKHILHTLLFPILCVPLFGDIKYAGQRL